MPLKNNEIKTCLNNNHDFYFYLLLIWKVGDMTNG